MKREEGRPGGGARARRRPRPLLAWLVFHRFHLLLAALFVAFPFVAVGPAAALFANLFVLTWSGQVMVGVLALLLGHVLVTTAWTSTRCGPLRLWPGTRGRGGVERVASAEFRRAFEVAWRARRWDHRLFVAADAWVAAALAAPTLIVVFRSSCAPPAAGLVGEHWFAARLGAVVVALAVTRLLRLGADFVGELLSPAPQPDARSILRRGGALLRLAREQTPRFAVRWRTRLLELFSRRPFGPGYVWVDRHGARHLHVGHLTCFALAAVTVAVYALFGWIDRPSTGNPWLPTLGSLLLVLTVVVWILPGLAFLLDRFRVPVVPALLLASFALFLVFGGDHLFRLVPAGGSSAAAIPATADEDLDAVDAWFAAGESPARPVVAVAAEGGGITAAAWTATALAGLASGDQGDAFLASLRLISGVSGGSVGAMFFVDRLPEVPLAEMGRLPSAWADEVGCVAGETSLASVGWAMAYPDLMRLLFSFPWATFRPELDRSFALEESWRRRLRSPAPAPTLADWRRAARAGRQPLLMMSATAVESGDRFVLSTLAAAESTPGAPAASFWGTFPGWDLAIPTAARLSSTFPFVGLAARAAAPPPARGARPSLPNTHFVDGGYADNSGLLAALDLLDRALARRCGAAGECAAPPVVVVRLRPFDPEAKALDEVGDGNAWLTAAASPIQTLAAVRTASQAERNALELRLFEARWESRGVVVGVVDLPLGGRGPLSWKLTEAERLRIRVQWDRENCDNADLAKLRAALAAGDFAAFAGASATASQRVPSPDPPNWRCAPRTGDCPRQGAPCPGR